MSDELTIQTSEGPVDLNTAADDIADSFPGMEIEAGAEGESESGQADDKPIAPAPASPTPAEGEKPAAPAIPPPDSLKGEIKAKWAELPADVQAEFVRRENDFHRGYQQIQPLAELGDGLTKIAAPYLPMLRHYGVNVVSHIENLLHHHERLMNGDANAKMEILGGLAQECGIDLAALAQGIIAANSGVAPNAAENRRIAQLEAQLSNVSGRFVEADRQAAAQKIDAIFEDTVNFPYILEVAPALIDMYKQNPNLNIYKAYAQAVAQDGVIQAKIVDGKVAARIDAERKAAAEKAAKASRARGVRIGSSTPNRPASVSAGNLDIDELLEETYAEIQSRS